MSGISGVFSLGSKAISENIKKNIFNAFSLRQTGLLKKTDRGNFFFST